MLDLAPFTRLDGWISLLTLTVLEVVLGIDNVVFLSIMTGKLPAERQPLARRLGLSLALVMRVLLLLAMSWLVTLQATLFTVFDEPISGRDLILIGGGLFLLAKSVMEIHSSLEGAGDEDHTDRPAVGLYATLVQIAVVDIVFSLDSVITAVGMVTEVAVMVLAIVIAVGIMMFAAKPIGEFVDEHPTIKMLALAFLILVGVALVGEGIDLHIPKGYIYFAMAFAFGVEMLNLRIRKARQPIRLRKEMSATSDGDERTKR